MSNFGYAVECDELTFPLRVDDNGINKGDYLHLKIKCNIRNTKLVRILDKNGEVVGFAPTSIANSLVGMANSSKKLDKTINTLAEVTETLLDVMVEMEDELRYEF